MKHKKVHKFLEELDWSTINYVEIESWNICTRQEVAKHGECEFDDDGWLHLSNSWRGYTMIHPKGVLSMSVEEKKGSLSGEFALRIVLSKVVPAPEKLPDDTGNCLICERFDTKTKTWKTTTTA